MVENSRYAIACITCERAALIRGPIDIADRLWSARNLRTEQSLHLIDESGFADSDNDNLFLTICLQCEYSRAQQYGLAMRFDDPEVYNSSRLANPYIAAALIKKWSIISVMKDVYHVQVQLSGNTNARPILKIELISQIVDWGETPTIAEVEVVRFEGKRMVRESPEMAARFFTQRP